MLKNWRRALDFNLIWEGGWAERENEPGGAVNKGVSLLAYKEWCAKMGRVEPSKWDLQNISDKDVSEFYRQRADQIGFDDLPSGYDLLMFNASTMQGVTGAKELDKIAKGDMGHFIALHMQKKLDDPRSGWFTDTMTGRKHRFGPGWAKRLVAAYEAAKELADGDDKES